MACEQGITWAYAKSNGPVLTEDDDGDNGHCALEFLSGGIFASTGFNRE